MQPSSKLNDVMKLADHGFSVIPVGNDKKPTIAWKAYQARKPDASELKQWFGPTFADRNVGIVTGAVSGIVVVDVDQPHLFDLDIPKTPTVKTGKGFHYYFSYPGFDVGNAKLPYGDLKGDGGYVVAPPSKHPSGADYEWLVPFGAVPLAELPSELIALAYKPEPVVVTTTFSAPANDNDVTTPYGEAWFKDCMALGLVHSGDRNNQLNIVATKAGSLIAGGQLTFNDAMAHMLAACRKNGLMKEDGRGVGATIKSGIAAGKKQPRVPAEIERGPAEPVKPGRLSFRKASSITAEKLEWLWPGVLPKNAMSILAGNPGLGKSQVALSIAATITSGGKWPVAGERAPIGNVIVLSGEDSAEHTIIPRLTAAGANLDRVFILDMVTSDDGTQRQFNLQDDIPKLREALDDIGGVSLIIIDVLNAYLAKADTNNSGDVRRITNDLTYLANTYDLCVLGLAHLNKTEGKQAAHRVQGSISWVGAARTAWLIEKDEDGGRSMSPIKNNLAKDTQAYSFDVVSKDLPDGIATSIIVWDDASQAKTADQALADRSDGVKTREAKEFLAAFLDSGPKPHSEVMAKAKELGVSQPTLYRARDKLNVFSQPENDVPMWTLPKAA